jgi:protein TonB
VKPAPEAAPVEVHETAADYKGTAAAVSQEPALFSTVGSPNDSGSNSKKMLLVAAVVLVAAGGIYFGLTKMRSSHTSVAATPANATPATSAVSPSGPPVVSAQVTASPFPAATQPAVSSAATPAVPAAAKSAAPAAETKAPKAAASKSSDVEAAPDAPAPLMVQGGRMPAPPPPPNTADPDAPVVDVASNNSASALSGIVGSGAVSLPKASGQSLQVSQGVSQGLLVHKVNPVYPRQAQEGHIQGSVQLLATIAEDGSISSVKVLKGDAALASAAADAVKQWKYKPYYLDGQPIAIQTQITLNFKLP